MIILVNGKKALLKSGFSFDYVSENRLFLGRDGYTLSMSFPLKDCPENIDIFGQIHRADATKDKINFECSIVDSKISLFGTLSVVKISESEVECQFSAGRCAQTVTDPFEDVYINELDLGYQPSGGSYTPLQAWESIDQGRNEVALPWINEAFPTQFNNWAVKEKNVFKWDKSVYVDRLPSSENQESLSGNNLSWQPYLIYIAKKICEAIGYTYDFYEWDHSNFRYLIVCNSLPYTWTEGELRNYKSIMPKWTVTEFFAKLELLMMGEFEIDHKGRHISFAFTEHILSNVPPVEIKDVVDEYSADISIDNQPCEYLGAKRLAYKECSHSMQPYYACDWFDKSKYVIKEYDFISDLITANQGHTIKDSLGANYFVYGDGASISEIPNSIPTVWDATNHIMYARYEDTYFVFRSIGTFEIYTGRRPGGAQMYVLQPINVFGSGSNESDDVDTEEIDFVPVCVSDTHVSEEDDKGYMMFLSFSSYQDDTTVHSEADPNTIIQSRPASSIEAGQKEDKTEYYDVVYVGFWKSFLPNSKYPPYPLIDRLTVAQDWTYTINSIPMLRLFGKYRDVKNQLPAINTKQKFKFSWLDSKIPNPRAIFYIRGKRYVCEKITATFTENGMSQLLKGEFYPLID